MTTAIKPIKRSEHLVELSRDHHDGLLLCWKIRTGFVNGTEPGRIKTYVLFFFDHALRAHFLEEEEILFGLMPDDEPMKAEAFAQHAQLYGMVESLRKGLMAPENLLPEFADCLSAHIRFEERQLFPWIESHATAGALAEAGRKLAGLHQRKTALIWGDEFWTKKK
jgi:hemerythrin-like domain-containing protein